MVTTSSSAALSAAGRGALLAAAPADTRLDVDPALACFWYCAC
jgi:hypothetical protein